MLSLYRKKVCIAVGDFIRPLWAYTIIILEVTVFFYNTSKVIKYFYNTTYCYAKWNIYWCKFKCLSVSDIFLCD